MRIYGGAWMSVPGVYAAVTPPYTGTGNSSATPYTAQTNTPGLRICIWDRMSQEWAYTGAVRYPVEWKKASVPVLDEAA